MKKIYIHNAGSGIQLFVMRVNVIIWGVSVSNKYLKSDITGASRCTISDQFSYIYIQFKGR